MKLNIAALGPYFKVVALRLLFERRFGDAYLSSVNSNIQNQTTRSNIMRVNNETENIRKEYKNMITQAYQFN